jgi:tetratricopeptide (TPR) repeat protein
MRALGRSTLLLAALPVALVAQQVNFASSAPQRLRVTTSSEEASRHFWAGLSDARNIFFSRAASHFDRAASLDANLGLARVFHAAIAPGLTPEERKAEVDRGIATMTSASTGELLTALALREFVADNRRQAHELFRTASDLLPGDPNVAFYAAITEDGRPAQIQALRSVKEKFPDDAPAYNILAYDLWLSGDHAGGLTAVRKYVELAPDQPNAHDSYAELLQWDGRYSEALDHYARAAQLDSSFNEAYLGSAEVLTVTGRGADARRQIQLAISHAPSKASAVYATRALAHSFLMDGLYKEGMDQLATAARDAQALNRKPLAAELHLEMAVFDAVLGQGTAIASHLATANEVRGDPNNPMQFAATGFANATAGDVATARQAAQKLKDVAGTDQELGTILHVVNAAILLRENKPAEARTELSGASPEDPLVRALLAESYRASGNVNDARTIRNQVLSNPQLDLSDMHSTIARVRASRIKF